MMLMSDRMGQRRQKGAERGLHGGCQQGLIHYWMG